MAYTLNHFLSRSPQVIKVTYSIVMNEVQGEFIAAKTENWNNIKGKEVRGGEILHTPVIRRCSFLGGAFPSTLQQ